jgi:UDP-2,4-diacetamido-2,4,6-trideoxy-beta-L-altropyranose hydrolase
MGIGHLMRCLALAQAWRIQNGPVVFFTHTDSPDLLNRLAQEGIQIERLRHEAGTLSEAREVAFMAGQAGLGWLVADGYHFCSQYLAELKNSDTSLLVIDDLAMQDLSAADIVLNENAYAGASMYPSTTRLLAGSTYALLRPEFRRWHEYIRPQPQEASEILVMLGGSDPENMTKKIIELLAGVETPKLKLRVVVGSTNPHVSTLRALNPGVHSVEFHLNPPQLPELMHRSDVVISAAGSTCWELACLGLPMLLVVTADNQRRVAASLQELGIAGVLGSNADFPPPGSLDQILHILKDQSRRLLMSERGRSLVDGKGASRVVEQMQLAR